MLFFHPHRELHNGSFSGASSEFPHFLLLETCAFGTRLWASLVCDVCLLGPSSSWWAGTLVRGGKVPGIDWREGRRWRKGRRERREGVEMQPCVRRCFVCVCVIEEAYREEEGGKEKEEEEEQARCFVS